MFVETPTQDAAESLPWSSTVMHEEATVPTCDVVAMPVSVALHGLHLRLFNADTIWRSATGSLLLKGREIVANVAAAMQTRISKLPALESVAQPSVPSSGDMVTGT